MIALQETYDLQQEMILRDTAKVWRRMNPTVSIKDLKEQKTGFYIAEVFPVGLLWQTKFRIECINNRLCM